MNPAVLNLAALETILKARKRTTLEIPEFKRAAVLVPIVLEPAPSLILTERSRELPTHKGQIAFPGGKLEPGEDALGAALREAHEEIGLEPGFVTVLGLLNDVWTPQGFQVTPVLAQVSSAATLSAHPGEVARLLHVPLADLLKTAPRQEIRLEPPVGRWPPGVSGPRAILHFDWDTPAGTSVDIWGMTAFVIQELLDLLRGSQSEVL